MIQSDQAKLIEDLRTKFDKFSFDIDDAGKSLGMAPWSTVAVSATSDTMKAVNGYSSTMRSNVSLVLSLKPRLALNMRSVGEMISFLGDLTFYQEQIKPSPHHSIPVTLGYCAHDDKYVQTDPKCDDLGVLFNVTNPNPVNPRFVVSYRGGDYPVDAYSKHDHTLQTLSILTQLLNLNKSASDIRTTPYVEVLP